MEREKEERYYSLFEKLIDSMTDPEHFERRKFVELLSEICGLFHIAKGVTEFYTSLTQEKAGQGERLIDYDNGHGDKVVLHKRFVSPTGSVVIGTLYMAQDETPMTEDETAKIDVILRALLSFVSRNRLQTAVEMLGFYDDDGYPNIRSFMRYGERLNEKGVLAEYDALNYNLRHFALVNRDVGRKAGDYCMRQFYNLVKDVVGEDGIVCRMGGDNFIAMVRKPLLQPVLKLLRGTAVAYDPTGENRVNLSASAGVFEIPAEFALENNGDIMNKLVMAFTRAKREEGDSAIVFYNEAMEDAKDRMMRFQRMFPVALEKKEFKVFYQPKVDVLTGNIVGAEALCRWFRDGRIVPPMEFIPFLEQSMDICKLDFYMLDCVCKDIVRWLAEGRNVVRISVNLSRKHLSDADLLEHIMTIIDNNKVPHEYIEIELTETTTDVEFKDLKRVVGGLQERGVYTSVDDFGIGYSSLNLIREIPWDVLKIDRCFLPADEEQESSVTGLMFKHVVSMAQDMGLECIVEGVETVRQIELLRNNHCNIAQGFYFDKPLPMEDFENKMGSPKYPLP